MTDAALENALARRKAIGERLDRGDKEIDALIKAMRADLEEFKKVNAFIRDWYEMAGVEPPENDDAEERIQTGMLPPPKAERQKNPDRTFVAEKAVEYIREAGRPLMRRELFERMAGDNIIIRGKYPEMVLSTMLWRSQHIVQRLPQGGYWPADLPPPLPIFTDQA